LDFVKDYIYGVSRADVTTVLKHCAECQARRLMTTNREIRPIIARYPRDRYIADLIDLHYYSHLNNGFSWILVIIDSCSKFLMCVPCRSKAAGEIASAIEQIFSLISPPALLQTDNGKKFTNRLLGRR